MALRWTHASPSRYLRAALDRRSRQAPRNPQAGPRDRRRGGDRDMARYGDGAGDMAHHRDPRLPRRLDRDARRPWTKSLDRDLRAPRRTPPRRDLPRGDGGAHGRRREPALLPALRPGGRRHAPVLVSDGPQDRVVGHVVVPLGGPGHPGGPVAGGDDVRGGRPAITIAGLWSSPWASPGSPHRRNANCGIRGGPGNPRRWGRTSMPRVEQPGGIPRILLAQLCDTFRFVRGVVLASPEGDLELLAATEVMAPEAVPGGLDPFMSRACPSGRPNWCVSSIPRPIPVSRTFSPRCSRQPRCRWSSRVGHLLGDRRPPAPGTAGPCGSGGRDPSSSPCTPRSRCTTRGSRPNARPSSRPTSRLELRDRRLQPGSSRPRSRETTAKASDGHQASVRTGGERAAAEAPPSCGSCRRRRDADQLRMASTMTPAESSRWSGMRL